MTEPRKFRKKPVVIEAMQFDGENFAAVRRFAGAHVWATVANRKKIQTLNGPVHLNKGDYVAKTVKGDYYPCSPDVFEATHEEVSDS